MYHISQNELEQRFELPLNNQIAYVDYELWDGGISLLHTIVPPELEGKGIGSALARYVLDYAHTWQLEVDASCPFIRSYMEKHKTRL